ncbi:hypothetical protein LEAN103870_02000 [Legionella anisa]|uniref:Type IV secretion protein Dot n=1 Tax=Legionella anisa TaxID=28082 RepID=A0AAX0WSB0_9GAMM|nr:hypothetical protein [Legionella anisa]AWN75328.1 hypothetical protein DLD14_16620 [Legionella anisa]KTC72691.1 hypothetical protein Lani_0915 [Legionella anisa]MBN5935508.1 hypothetical protein [Legionella anisa]MCW8424500.1 hypothetical protein [Legionella anisa]MCW8446382.1 hypothetical protein [Legionella anisa]
MTVKVDFRCAFLEYLLDPSWKNKKELRRVSIELYYSAAKTAKEKKQDADIDDINTEISTSINEAIKNIYISQKQLDALLSINLNLPKIEAAFGTVLSALTGTLQGIADDDEEGIKQEENSRIVNDKHYKAFAAIYPIELDGHRITKEDSTAGQAALTLSETLLSITAKIHNADKLEESDTRDINQAYEKAKGQGIENHRGFNFKEKFYNFCRAVSCIFILPIGYYVHQGSLWTTVKTKTQEDVDKSQEAIGEYQQSLKKQ